MSETTAYSYRIDPPRRKKLDKILKELREDHGPGYKTASDVIRKLIDDYKLKRDRAQ